MICVFKRLLYAWHVMVTLGFILSPISDRDKSSSIFGESSTTTVELVRRDALTLNSVYPPVIGRN